MASDALLTIENLTTAFDTEAGRIRAVEGISFTVPKSRTLGIVGESGCGKSVTALSIMRLLPRPAGTIEAGRILFNGRDLAGLPAEEMHHIRGKRIAMIFQEPMTALNPVQRLGTQLGEVFELHFPEMDPGAVETECINLLRKVGIPAPEARLKEYPHQISGGMRQRVMIAAALAGQPDLLIADEPTTALDVTIQAQILDLMRSLQQETGMAIIFITHDLGVIAEMADEVLVMYAGQVAERAPIKTIYTQPRHPYTQGLLASIPRLATTPKSRLPTIEGIVPSLLEMPGGCRFQNRCPRVMEICRDSPPPMYRVGREHWASCFLHRGQPAAGEVRP